MNSNLYLLCVRCKKNGRFICERCSDPYCTKMCQVLDWPFHRKICFPMPSLVEIPNDRNMISMCDKRSSDNLALTYHANNQNQSHFGVKNNNNGNNNNYRKYNNYPRPLRNQSHTRTVRQEICDSGDPGSVPSLESKKHESAVTQQCSPTHLQKCDANIAERPVVLNESEGIINLAAVTKSAGKIPLTEKQPTKSKSQSNWDENVNEKIKELESLMSNDPLNWRKPFPLEDDSSVTVAYFVESPTTNCWVVQNKHTTKSKHLQDEMKRLHCNDGATEIHKLIINEVYSVQYKDMYYRGACVYQVNSKEVLIQLIDVGLTFQTQANAVRNLDQRLRTINALAVEINLESSLDVNVGQILRIKQFSVDATGTINVKLGQQETVVESTKQSIEILTLPLPENVSMELFCLDYTNIEKGYISACIHDPEKIESINRLSDKIRNYLLSHGKGAGMYSPKINETCFAFHDSEFQWYRAECIGEVSADRFEVIFIDYGTTRIVNSSHLREFVAEFNQPSIMHFCYFKGVPLQSTDELIKKIIAFLNENPFFTVTSAKYVDDDGLLIVDCPALLNAIR